MLCLETWSPIGENKRGRTCSSLKIKERSSYFIIKSRIVWTLVCVFSFGKPQIVTPTNACDFHEHFCVFEDYLHINAYYIAYSGILLLHIYVHISLFWKSTDLCLRSKPWPGMVYSIRLFFFFYQILILFDDTKKRNTEF